MAFVGPAKQRGDIWHFMDTYLDGSTAEMVRSGAVAAIAVTASTQVPLGCDGYKLNVDLQGSQNSDRQLHYVTAPNLPSKTEDQSIDSDGWVKLWME
jgi:hypothetical protein